MNCVEIAVPFFILAIALEYHRVHHARNPEYWSVLLSSPSNVFCRARRWLRLSSPLHKYGNVSCYEIPPDVTPVFICRSGARSLTACGIALRGGALEACHLDGGMLAWET